MKAESSQMPSSSCLGLSTQLGLLAWLPDLHRLIRLSIAALLLAFSSATLAQLDGPSLSSFTDLSRDQFKPLPLEQAFPYYLSAAENANYRVLWETAPEHYLYQNKFNFSYLPTADSAPQVVEYQLPDGIKKNDEFFGEVEVYFSNLKVDLILPEVPRPDSVLIIEFQGCAEWGFCYPPQKVFMPLN